MRAAAVRPAWVFITVYVLLALIANYPSWVHDPGSWMGCGGCGDAGQQVWFLRWQAFALTHAQDPLRTNWINYPWGADLATLTSLPLVGIVATPITLLFGPVFTWNLMNVVAFASSATAAMFACRRWVRSWWAAFIGGLLYGFSPFMVAEGIGHLFLTLNFVPPLLLLLLHDVLIRQAWSWKRSGVLLAGLVVAQLGISLELLAEEALVSAVGVLIVLAARREWVRDGWTHIWRSLALGIGLALPFVLWVAITGFTGPEHARGPAHPVSLLAGLSSDLLSSIAPTTNQHFDLGTATYGTKFVALPPGNGLPPSPDAVENGSYIGIPLLLLLVIGTWRLRRDAMVRFGWLMALISYLLSMGSRLRVGGHDTGIPLPFAIFTHLPILKSEVASRYAVCTWLFLALLTAVVVDRWIFAPAPRTAGVSQGRRRGWRAGGLILLALSLLALVPEWPYGAVPDRIPPWFASSAVKQIPERSTLVTYPYANTDHNLPMFWQAIDGMRWRIPLGEAAVPDPHFRPFEVAFYDCWNNPTLKAPPTTLTGTTRLVFRFWHVSTVVVPLQFTTNPYCAIRYLTAALGRPPQWQHQAAVWRLPVVP